MVIVLINSPLRRSNGLMVVGLQASRHL